MRVTRVDPDNSVGVRLNAVSFGECFILGSELAEPRVFVVTNGVWNEENKFLHRRAVCLDTGDLHSFADDPLVVPVCAEVCWSCRT